MEETNARDDSQPMQHVEEKPSHAQHHTLPRLLVIGSETAVFDPRSPVRARILAYARHFGETHLIVMCRGRYRTETVGNVTFHPTNSPTRLLYGTHALLIVRKLPKPDVVSAQDPHDSGLLGLWIVRMRGSAFHVQVHADVFASSYRAHSMLNAFRSRIAQYVLARADGIRVVSRSIKESIEQRLMPKRPIAVLPIFIDIAHFRAALPGTLSER